MNKVSEESGGKLQKEEQREEGSPELLRRQGLGEQLRAGVNLNLGFTSVIGSTHTPSRKVMVL